MTEARRGPRLPAPSGILFVFAYGTDNRYSMTWWDEAFREVGPRVVGDAERVHFAYSSLGGSSPSEPARRLIRFDAATSDAGHLRTVAEYVHDHDIQLVFGFDFPVHRPAYRMLREAGVRTIVSYWGAPMSGLNRGLRLLLKRAEVRFLARHQPDHYVFQAEAMARTAVEGRGIPANRVTVCRSGVDERRYAPAASLTTYAHDVFGIPRDRRIALYAGHLSERKGLRVIIEAARALADERGRRDVHFLLLGEESAAARYGPMLSGSAAENMVTFGGYRNDMPKILQSTYVGLRPSTGWDSFPVSCMEMSSSGVPLITSDQGGLPEMVDDFRTGRVVPAGSHIALADAIASLAEDPSIRERWSAASRQRILTGFTREQFVDRLSALIQEVWVRTA